MGCEIMGAEIHFFDYEKRKSRKLLSNIYSPKAQGARRFQKVNEAPDAKNTLHPSP